MKQVLTHLRKNWIGYAFETLVVVIGIMIAFTLNNWNQNRQNRKTELRYLINLKEEFGANLEETEFGLSGLERYSASTELILKTYSNDTIVDPRALAMALEFSTYGSPPSIKSNVWNDLISSGNLGLISNADLKNSISEYFSLNDKHWEFYKSSWNVTLKQTELEFINSLIIPSQDRLMIAKSFRSYLQDSIIAYPEVSVDFDFIQKRLKATKELEALLASTYIIHTVNINLTLSSMDDIRDILKVLSEEIDRLK